MAQNVQFPWRNKFVYIRVVGLRAQLVLKILLIENDIGYSFH